MENIKENKNSIKEVEESSDLVVPEQLKTILADPGIPEDKKEAIIRLVVGVSFRESFRGPIPPPKLLKGYNEAVKDGAERIVAMAENQSDE